MSHDLVVLMRYGRRLQRQPLVLMVVKINPVTRAKWQEQSVCCLFLNVPDRKKVVVARTVAVCR